MTRSELHDIAVRRRGDPDVKALLLEIRRLRGVLVQAHGLASALPRYEDDLNAAYTVARLVDLLEEEPAIVEPPQPVSGKPARSEPEQRFPHIPEGEARQQERDRRG